MVDFERYFLTGREADSYIAVCYEKSWENKDLFSIQVKIADCDRNVKLQFPCHKKKNIKKSLKKLDRLLQPLLRVKAALEQKLSEIQD